MFVKLCLLICGYFGLVKSNVQYQQLLTYPYSTSNYGNIYGNQPITVQSPNPYNQQYTLQSPVPNYASPEPMAGQLQEPYLRQILSDPTIQAFIDPSTKIYNQNGIEISDQIRTKTPNVVNNYFIVPTEYLKPNKPLRNTQNSDGYKRNNIAVSSDTTDFYVGKVNIDSNIHESKKSSINENKQSTTKEPKHAHDDEQIKQRDKSKNQNQEQKNSNKNRRRKTKSKTNNLSNKNIMIEEEDFENVHKNNIKRQYTTEKLEKVSTEGVNNKKVERKKKQNTNKNNKTTNDNIERLPSKLPSGQGTLENRDKLETEVFAVRGEGNKIENRNIRNPVDSEQSKEPIKKSPTAQENFMKQWMSYLKTFSPNQNFDSFDLTNSNFPYNFEQMFQYPKVTNSGAQNSNSNPSVKNRRRKQQRGNKQKAKNCDDKTTIELDPKFIVIESEPDEKVQENANVKTIEIPLTQSLEEAEINSRELLPIMYDVIDYYPDFTKDPIYASDEDDLYYFHNRHFYTTEDEDDTGRIEYETKRSTNKVLDSRQSANEIPTFEDNNFKDHHKLFFEEEKFQTPPALTDPGFETKKVSVQKGDLNTYHSNGNDNKIGESKRNDVETVFARSKVVRYGQKDEEKPKVVKEEHHRNDRERKHKPKDDTTVIFAQSW